MQSDAYGGKSTLPTYIMTVSKLASNVQERDWESLLISSCEYQFIAQW